MWRSIRTAAPPAKAFPGPSPAHPHDHASTDTRCATARPKCAARSARTQHAHPRSLETRPQQQRLHHSQPGCHGLLKPSSLHFAGETPSLGAIGSLTQRATPSAPRDRSDRKPYRSVLSRDFWMIHAPRREMSSAMKPGAKSVQPHGVVTPTATKPSPAPPRIRRATSLNDGGGGARPMTRSIAVGIAGTCLLPLDRSGCDHELR